MAARFDLNLILEHDRYTARFDKATGLSDKFLDACQSSLAATEFPNISHVLQDYESGGVFFNKEVTKMLALSFTKSQFQQLVVFFRAQQFGNVVVFSKFETIESGFMDILSGKSGAEKLALIRKRCKNMAQYEEFTALRQLGDLVFWDALRRVDPNYEERQKLAQLAPKSES